METFVQLLVNGLMLAGVYIGLTIGLTLIFGVIKVVNFAHGEFLMVGLYATWIATTFLKVPIWVALLAVPALLFAMGWVLQRLVLEPLLDAPPAMQIFATVGVSTLLINLALLAFGGDLRQTPPTTDTRPLDLGGINILGGQVLTLAVSLAIAWALHLFLTRTFMGLSIKAISQNRNSAALMGVNVKRMYAVTFAIGCACVGVVSVLTASQYPASPSVGTHFILVAFVIVVLGGLGNVAGAILASFVIGIVDSVAGYYVSLGLKEVIYFSIFILILIVRPTGLLGKETGA